MGLVYCRDQWGLHFFSRGSDATESMMGEGTNRNGEKTDRIKDLKLKKVIEICLLDGKL